MKALRKTVIIFGGTGYVGSHIAIQLFQKGFFVILAESIHLYNDSNYTGLRELCNNFVKLQLLDWQNESEITEFLKNSQADAIVFAGNQYFEEEVAPSLLRSAHFHLDSALNILSSIESQLSVPVIMISSYKVYGKTRKTVLKEDYKLLKGATNQIELNALLEKFLKLSNDKFVPIIVRLSFPIGAHDSLKIGPAENSCSGEFYTNILNSVHRLQPYTIYFRKSTISKLYKSVDLIHVTDAAEAVALIVRHSLLNNIDRKRIYNVSSNQVFSGDRFAKALQFFSKAQFEIEERELDASDNLCIQLSNNKLIADLGWFGKYQLIHAIQSHVEYIKQITNKSSQAA